MNKVLEEWNVASRDEALAAMMACCGANRWAQAMLDLRPFEGVEELSAAAGRLWSTMEEADWMEAFSCHPRIGSSIPAAGQAPAHGSARSQAWSRQEQASAGAAAKEVLAELAAANACYEDRFGFTCIVCATGKSGEQMLSILRRRLESERGAELREAAEQQRQIMQIRLGKWLME